MRNTFQLQTIQDFQIELPNPTLDLNKVFGQLKLYSKQRLDGGDSNGQILDPAQQIKGLKFISAKLAKLFHKNRKLPYNQISKILIDNFASQQNDQRNIKRRVYDAINVLVASGVLIKKNNFVQMIKNKIKIKHQNQKKDIIEDELKQKQQNLEYKIERHKILMRKHKLIKKLFNRNMKNQQSYNLKKQNIQLKKNSKNIDKFSNYRQKQLKLIQNQMISSQYHQKQMFQQKIILNPKILIRVDNSLININQPFQKLIQKFKNSNSLNIMIPFKKRQQYKCIKQENNNQMKQQNEQIYSQQIYQQDKDCDINFFIQKDGPYSLIDLIELLSLDEEFNQQ